MSDATGEGVSECYCPLHKRARAAGLKPEPRYSWYANVGAWPANVFEGTKVVVVQPAATINREGETEA